MASVRTGDDVAIPVTVCGLLRRTTAALADGLLLLPLFVACGAVVAASLGLPLPKTLALVPAFLLEMVLLQHTWVVVSGVQVALIVVIYEILFIWLMGATPGMRVLRMRMVTESGFAPTLSTAVARAFALAFSTVPFALGLLWIGFDREKRGLHDHLARTYVVREFQNRRVSMSQMQP